MIHKFVKIILPFVRKCSDCYEMLILIFDVETSKSPGSSDMALQSKILFKQEILITRHLISYTIFILILTCLKV